MVNFPVHQYAKDQIIFEEGTIANVAYILKSGSVEISTQGIEGKLVLAILKPGAIFGEMALLLKDNKRTATATASENSEVIAIYKNYFMEYFKDSPVVIINLINGLVERLYETTSRLSKSDHLTLEIKEILSLLVKHGIIAIKYDDVLQTIHRCSEIEIPAIESQLAYLEKLGHLQINVDTNGKKVINLPYKRI